MKTAIVGLQWGDEGKGKIVTYFSKFYDYVVRYSGGSNAGHTVEYDDNTKFVHHLFPSIHKDFNTKAIISGGVVVDIGVLLDEIRNLSNVTSIKDKLLISELCHIVLPVHKKLDEKLEKLKKGNAIGTTKRGIGPAYADRVGRIGVRLKDFKDKSLLMERLNFISKLYKELYNIEWTEFQDLINSYEEIADYVKPHLKIIELIKNSKVLFEGTQGILLDVDAGTYPYVTSTNCNLTNIPNSVGFPLSLEKRIGVFKAYLTRVGNGPFPTEVFEKELEDLRKRGHEFGATTGRPRRCGWLDLVLLKYAVNVSGCNELIMTKADILNGLEKIPVCVAYKNGTKVIDELETLDLENVTPVYEYLPGWQSLEDSNFVNFVRFVEKHVGINITHISTGPKVDQIIKT
ncbi:adenylosuccinate synthase [Thermosipho ferrireducens]|uniref:Adenylosuccinate synthetase n=1 Tax=Thermosipho ferrireducens TaxID=2571116 RepID=A0ABX7S8H4_9BACT|nr:adenylosuccinate synthase [Thermosipho ferrireducens]QTA38105.1 adenylosuccinate synthase [Thermosipho ferrireducens]